VQSFLSEASDYPAFLVAATSEGVHPVVGLWPLAMAPQIEDALRLGRLKVGTFIKEHGATEVFFTPVRIGARLVDPFYNINRPEDLTYAEALLREAP
jgi:molybdopterin-guanine dinucleotide biosynthesis protein A